MLEQGATALRDGRIADAVDVLERVLGAAPGDLDAMYLLGNARLLRGEFATAVQLLDRVLERLPDAVHAVDARQRAADALGRRIVEQEVCQAVLPRMMPHIVESLAVTEAGSAHFVLATAAIDDRAYGLAARAAAALAATRPTYWAEPHPALRSGPTSPVDPATMPQVKSIDVGRGTFPQTGQLVFVGAARSPAAWWSRCEPNGVALVIDEFAACEIVERIRELSGDGARRISLLFANGGLARRTRLPGRVIPEEP